MNGRQVTNAILLTLLLLNFGTTEAQVINQPALNIGSYFDSDQATQYKPVAFSKQPVQEQAQADSPAMECESNVCGCSYFGECQNCQRVKGCCFSKASCNEAGSLAKRDRLFGNTFGPKSALAEKGIVTNFVLGNYYQGVTTGGNEQTAEYGGKLDMYFDFVGAKFGLNEGFNLILHAETRWGSDILAAAGPLTLPNAPLLWPLPGDYHGTNITGLFATQNILDNRVGLVAGKLNTLDLVQGIIPEIGYGRESFLNVNALTTALPWFRFVNLSEWGGGFWTYDKEAGGQIAHGFLVFGLDNVSDNWDFGPSFEDGVGMLGWLRFFHEFRGKPGYFAVFAGGATKGYNSLDPTDWLDNPGAGPLNPVTERPWDIAPYFSQVLWQDECNKVRNIRFTTGGTIADSNPSFSNWNVFGKIEAFGLNPDRLGDRMGISGWYNGISQNVKDLAALAVGENVRDNWGIEMYYNREITPWFRLTPDLQVLQNSNGDTDTSLVLGVRGIIDL